VTFLEPSLQSGGYMSNLRIDYFSGASSRSSNTSYENGHRRNWLYRWAAEAQVQHMVRLERYEKCMRLIWTPNPGPILPAR